MPLLCLVRQISMYRSLSASQVCAPVNFKVESPLPNRLHDLPSSIEQKTLFQIPINVRQIMRVCVEDRRFFLQRVEYIPITINRLLLEATAHRLDRKSGSA